MGVRTLNTYIRNNCKKSMELIELQKLYGKTIVVDTSIYLYKFLQDDILLENFYLMIATFKKYNIKLIFVFDGKPPVEKYKLLDKRFTEKQEAKNKYDILDKILNDKEKNICQEDRTKIERKMLSLKKKFLRISKNEIDKVKELISAFGESYIDAENEADQLCAKIVIKKMAHACLSEDMDMFLYGCPRVLRYLSLVNKNVVLYDLPKILKELNLSFTDFKDICVLCGTDYSNNDGNHTCDMGTAFKYFINYKNSSESNFYNWIDKNIRLYDIIELYNIQNLFLLDNIDMRSCKLYCNVYNKEKVKNIMKDDGFIFVN